MLNHKVRYLVFISVIFVQWFLLFSAPVSVNAAEKRWSGSGDGASWEEADNWFSASVPSAVDDVSIDVDGASVGISKDWTAKTIRVGGRTESALTVEGFVYGTVSPAANTDNALLIRKDGTVVLQGSGTITMSGAFKNSEEALPDEPSFMFGAE